MSTLMEITSPEHDALVKLAEVTARATVFATDAACARLDGGMAALTMALSSTDGERYITAPGPGCTAVLDRWQWSIVDTHDLPRGAEIAANRLNTRNIRDGQAHLRAALAAAERSA